MQPARAAPAVDWSEIARRVVPAVVNISVAKIHRDASAGGIGRRESFSGSGFIVDAAGDIVTNKHVIDGAFRITVMLHDGTELPAHLVAAAVMIDIAVLKVDAGRPLPFVQLAERENPEIGEPVLAVGNPLGIGTSLSSGIISAVNRDLRNSPFDDYIQTDAAINHGNSGGPLIDATGRVIGVDTILLTNQKNEGSNGLGFAISATVVNYVVRHLRDPSSAPVGWIGTHVQDVTSELANAFGMRWRTGILLTRVDADSPAQHAGLRPGDIVLDYDGAPVSDARAFMRQVAITPIGRAVSLRVWQQGAERNLRVTIRAWPNLIEPRGATLAGADIEQPVQPPDLGLLLAPLTDLARRQYGLGSVDGVLVVAVDQQSEAFGQGVAPGEVIEQVDGVAVSTPAGVRALVRQAADRHGVVALLVLWRDGAHWIALHTGSSAPALTAQQAPRSGSTRQGENRAGTGSPRP